MAELTTVRSTAKSYDSVPDIDDSVQSGQCDDLLNIHSHVYWTPLPHLAETNTLFSQLIKYITTLNTRIVIIWLENKAFLASVDEMLGDLPKALSSITKQLCLCV